LAELQENDADLTNKLHTERLRAVAADDAITKLRLELGAHHTAVTMQVTRSHVTWDQPMSNQFMLNSYVKI
jgi:hypothetical protein